MQVMQQPFAAHQARPVTSRLCSCRRLCNHRPWLHTSKSRRPSRAPAASTDSRQALSKQLFAEVQNVPEKERSGPPAAAIKEILDQLRQVADQQGFTKAEPLSSVQGKFKQLVNTTDFVDESRSVPLGAVTFQQIGPQDLKMYIGPMVPSTNLGGLLIGLDSPDHYCIATPVKIGEGEHEGLVGISSVLGSYTIKEDTPHRQNISFESLKIEPADTSPDSLKAWLSVFKESNPTMDDGGVVVINFPQPIKGHRDFVYLDDNHQVTIGNRGGMVVVERCSQ